MLKISESLFIKSATQKNQYAETPYLEVAFCGKSNVGKSSLINSLLMRKKIAKTSSTPGKTKLINFFQIRVIRYNQDQERIGEGFFSLVDLPGYGYAKVSKTERAKWKIMIREYLETRAELRLMLMLVDIRHSIDSKDKLMVEMLNLYNIPYLIVATKSDKIPKNTIGKVLKNLAGDYGLASNQIIAVSSLKKTGMDHLTDRIEEVLF